MGGPDQARASLLQAMPLDPRAKAAIAIFALVALADVVAVAIDIDAISVADRLADGERVRLGEARDIDDRIATVGLVQAVGLVLAIVSFLVWWSRAYKNAIAMGIPYPRYTTGWAIGWWFVPFANLVVPKKIANDIYRGSDPEMPYRDPGFLQRPVSPLLHWWWAAWLLSSILDQFASPDTLDAENAASFGDQMRRYLVADAFEIVAVALAIAVIVKITRRSEERRRRFPDGIPGAVPPAPPPPPPPPRQLPVLPPPPGAPSGPGTAAQ
jgi:uncharacterized protein DUF4328